MSDLAVSAIEPSVVLLNLTQPHAPAGKSDHDDDHDDGGGDHDDDDDHEW